MARSDWAALITEPAAEYTARTELERYGLQPYLPQLRKRCHTRAGKFVMRQYPLFPRYILIPYGDAYNPSTRLARGIARYKCVLADEDGRPWRAPNHVIDAVRVAESSGRFDEILHKGDHVTLSCGILSTIRSVLGDSLGAGMVDMLTPLFGGVRVRVDPARLVMA